MQFEINKLPNDILLGKQTETGVKEIRIDVSAWLEKWPELTISIWAKRPGEAAAYPVDCSMDGKCIVWRVNDADTAIPGAGAAEIMGISDGKKVLSRSVNTHVSKTIIDATTEPPEAYKPYVDKIVQSNRHQPIIGENGNWMLWDFETESYVDSGVQARGIHGEKGEKGEPGPAGPQGEPGQDAPQESVLYTPQTLTADQQTQARENIGAADAVTVNGLKDDVVQLAEDMTGKLSEPTDGLAVGKYFRVAALDENGHAVLEAVDAKTVGVQDVQVSGESIVTDGVANVPIMKQGGFGVAKIIQAYGVTVLSEGQLALMNASIYDVDTRISNYRCITANRLDYAVKAAMCDGKGAAWTADEQAAARERMGLPGNYDLIEEIICDGEASMYLRTVEPDGTPYDFKSIYAELEIQPSNVYSTVFFRAYEEDGTTVLYDGISTQTKSYTSHLFAGCDACSGFYHGWMINSNIGVSNIGGAAYKRINMPKVIVSPIKSFRINLNSGKFYAGDKIRIYGVRA